MTPPQRHEFQEIVAKAKTVAIFGHRNIDGDCVGSCLAIGTLLTNQGKQVSYFTPDQPMHDFNFVEKIDLFQTQFDYAKSYDLLLFLDTATQTSQLKDFRTAYPEYFTNHPTKVVIDHHQTNQGYGNLNIIDPTASSACELLAEIVFELYPEQITTEIATYLFMGVSTDTGHFFYDDDHGRTFAVASRLLSYGVQKKQLVHHLYQSNSIEQVQFLGHLIERIDKQENVIYTWFSHHELSQRGVDGQHIEHAIPVLVSIEHQGVFLLFKGSENDPIEPHLRCSFRTKNPSIDVSLLAAEFGGGGHRAAAGARIPLAKNATTLETIQLVIDQINNKLAIQ